MKHIKGNSGLMIPIKTGKMSKNREISAQAISDWCSQLKLSDLSGCAKALFLTLQDSHQAPLTYQERFEILSILRPTLKFITQALQKFYEEQEVLTETQHPIADLVSALHNEMVDGYKLVVDEATAHLFYDSHIMMSALQDAFSHCSKIIFYAYEQHRGSPQDVWLEFHALYLFAKEKKLLKKSLKRYSSWQCRFNTLADIYKHCLLFSIANPNYLRRSQIIQANYAMESWAPLMIIKDDNATNSCLFVIDPNQDSPPRYIGLFGNLPSNGYFIDLTHVTEHIEKLLSLHANNNHEKIAKLFSAAELALPLPYLDSISQAFKNLRKRMSERQAVDGEHRVCLGITNCHWFASLPQTQPMDAILQDDLDPAMANKFVTFTCQIVNQSEKGLCLNWTQSIPPLLQTGEIIGIQLLVNNQVKWAIGTIRWLKNETSYSTLLGVEILSKEALPVKTRLSDSASSYLVPTLVFPCEEEKHIPMRLVAPPIPFKTGNEIEIEHDSHLYAAVLQKSYSASPSYQEFGLHFTYQQLEFPVNPTRLPVDNQGALNGPIID